jgi:catechol 2,3-dioxygenase
MDTPKVRLNHVAVPARNPKQLAAFYRDFLGLRTTLEGALPPMGDFVFLSDRPEQFQTLAFMTEPRGRHIAWQVDSLAALKAVYADAKEKGIVIDMALNHQATWSLYLHDPEGNGIEVFWATGERPAGPVAEPLDLALLEQPTPTTT